MVQGLFPQIQSFTQEELMAKIQELASSSACSSSNIKELKCQRCPCLPVQQAALMAALIKFPSQSETEMNWAFLQSQLLQLHFSSYIQKILDPSFKLTGPQLERVTKFLEAHDCQNPNYIKNVKSYSTAAGYLAEINIMAYVVLQKRIQ